MRKLCTLLVVLFAIVMNARAYDFFAYNSDGVKIYYEQPDYYVAELKVTFGDDAYSGYVEIPATVNVNGQIFTVIGIGVESFSGDSQLTSVSIPNTVRTIERNAFFNCRNLTSITLPESIESIGNYAFAGCENFTTFEFPPLVTNISEGVLHGCSALTTVSIGSNICATGNEAFAGCDSLDNFVLTGANDYLEVSQDGNLLIINAGGTKELTAFAPYNVTSLDIPEGITKIGNGAFKYTTSLKSVSIPNSVTSIGDNAFGSSGITSVHLPNSVTHIGERAFYASQLSATLTIPTTVTEIGEQAFGECSKLSKVLYNAISAENNSSIGIFSNSSVNTIIIGNEVQKIPDNAFSFTDNIETITIPESVTYIGRHAFHLCSLLTEVNYNATNVSYCGDSPFFLCNKLTTFNIGNNVQTLPDYICADTKITSINIPNSVTSIGLMAFYNCKELTSVIIPNSVTSIGSSAFTGCSNLISITLPNSIETIESATFQESGLTSIIIPESVTSIGIVAFYHCTNLTHVTMGNSVTSIDDCAFSGCTDLSVIYCYATTPPSLYSYFNPFTNVTTSDVNLRVPASATSAYQAADIWKDFNISAIEDVIYTIQVAANNTDYGVAVISGDGNFASGETATATATPNTGYAFVNWTENGEVVSTSAEYGFIVTENRQLVANFEHEYQITAEVAPEDAGVVSGQGAYIHGNTVILTANPNEGYFFVNFTENGTEVSNSARYEFTATEPRSLVANFDIYRYDINVAASPAEYGTVTGSGTYDYGALVSLTADANEGYSFTNWTENGDVVSTDETYSFRAYNPRNLVANFVVGYTIDLTCPEGGTVTGGGIYAEGTNLTVSAAAFEGYTFRNWTENGEVVSTDAEYNFTVNSDRDLVANITLNEYNISASASPVEGGSVAGAGVFHHGDNVMLSTICNTGYSFAGWYENDVLVTESGIYTFTAVENRNLVAKFPINQYVITVNNDIDYGTISTSHSGPTNYGTEVVITAIPDEGYQLAGLSVYKTGDPATTVTVMDNRFILPDYDVTVTATFEVFYDEDNHLTLYAPEVLISQPVPVEIGMENEATDLTAVQFDIIIPNAGPEWQLGLDDLYLSNRFAASHVGYISKIEQDRWRVIIYSTQNDIIEDNTGTIMTLTIPRGYMATGTYMVSIENVVLGDIHSVNRHTGPLPTLTITLYGYTLGDANGSGVVNIIDVTQTRSYILGLNPAPFYFAAADVNTDRMIDVLDVIGITSIILGTNRNSCDCPEQYAYYYVANGILYIETPVDIAGLQFDYSNMYADISIIGNLPGFEYAYDNGRFIIYSTNGNTIKAGKHALLRVGDNTLSDMIIGNAHGCRVNAVEEVLSVEDIICDNIGTPYPNPFHNTITIPLNIDNNAKEARLVVTNIMGQTVDVIDIDNIDGDYVYTASSDMEAGIYQLTLKVDGYNIKTVKIVKY